MNIRPGGNAGEFANRFPSAIRVSRLTKYSRPVNSEIDDAEQSINVADVIWGQVVSRESPVMQDEKPLLIRYVFQFGSGRKIFWEDAEPGKYTREKIKAMWM